MFYRANTKSKSKSGADFKGLLLIFSAFILCYFYVLPLGSGAVGNAVAKVSFLMFGKAAFFAPFVLLWWGIILLKPSINVHWRLDVLMGFLSVIVLSSFLSLFGFEFYKVNIGGWFGLHLGFFFRKIFGVEVGLLVTFLVFTYLISLLMRFSYSRAILSLMGKLRDDIEQWKKAKDIVKKEMPKIKQQESIKISKKEEPQQPALPVIDSKPVIAQKPEIPKILEKKPEKPKADKPVKTAPLPDNNTNQNGQLQIVPGDYSKYKIPGTELMSAYEDTVVVTNHEEHLAKADMLTKTLETFGISAKVKEIIPGPVITRYDIELAPGVKLSSVVALSDNIALCMKVNAVRIAAVSEKSAVGIEVPNTKSKIVGLRGVIESNEFQKAKSLLAIALGRTTDGSSYVANLEAMPHLLIAGATGSGKSVGIHSVITSILYKAKPDEVKFLLIDPKRLELPAYRGIPHLYDPCSKPEDVEIITKPKEAAASLAKLVKVMENRYEKFAKESVRNIEGYNEKMQRTGGIREFYIVVIIDELADLMLIATKEVEDSIQRLAQMARAVGIHLILATQRPSVDVITGVIKANFPARIAFQTTSKVDSRVILDTIGAEDLAGKGDMLFIPPGESRQIRLQGGFLSTKDVEAVVKYIRDQGYKASYEPLVSQMQLMGISEDDDKSVKDLVAALNLVQERKRVSQDLLKAHFGSSARATNILSLLETKGFIHKPEGTNRWQIHFDKIEEFLINSPGE